MVSVVEMTQSDEDVNLTHDNLTRRMKYLNVVLNHFWNRWLFENLLDGYGIVLFCPFHAQNSLHHKVCIVRAHLLASYLSIDCYGCCVHDAK